MTEKVSGMQSKGKWNKFKLVGSSSYQGSTVFGPYSLCTMTYLCPQFLNYWAPTEPLKCFDCHKEKRPLWTCHLWSFLFAPLSVASFLGRLFFFLSTYSNYLTTAANSNDQFQHQGLDLLCLWVQHFAFCLLRLYLEPWLATLVSLM